MLFNSDVFLFCFLPIVLLGWWLLPGQTPRLTFLALASWFFYGWWDWKYIPLMVLSTSVDWVAGQAIARRSDRPTRKRILVAAMAFNLALLGYFKYAGFFLDSGNGIGSLVGQGHVFPALHVVLPIGISFYTFNSMSYTIDVYRERVRPASNFLHYAAFVALFPHLIAGPIVRYSDIEDQLERLAPRLTAQLAGSGLFFFTAGMVKKLVFADQLAPNVNRVFAAHAHLGLLSSWAGAIGYSLQLYFDFSGYSDMAVGLAFLLGFRFPQNFNSPYKSRNISEFWRTWHMTLSFWIRDYIFIPLGGSRGTRAATLRNLIVTMTIGGLWHGAAWTFVIWGLAHGAMLAGHSILKTRGLVPRSEWLNRAITFACVVAAFVVFRAPSIGNAADVLSSMAGLHGIESIDRLHSLLGVPFVLLIAGLLVWVNVLPNTWQVRVRPRPLHGLALGLALGYAILLIGSPSPFLYFQF